MNKTVVLASGSPQRAAILNELGIPFVQMEMDVDEVRLPNPGETVCANAVMKVKAAVGRLHLGEVVVGADTVVCFADQVLGKPKDARQAADFLRMVSGRDVRAFTAVATAVVGSAEGWLATETSTARIAPMTDQEISWYVGMGEPLSRAGALGISRYGELFIESVSGSYSCFAGLPKRALLIALAKIRETKADVLPFGVPDNFLDAGTGRALRSFSLV